jgi:hypothetical protein
MGSLIQTLAEQAKSSIPEGTLSVSEWIESYNKKFAELIVRECEKVAKDGPWYYDTPSLRSGWQNPINHVCNVMKEHFGVEE